MNQFRLRSAYGQSGVQPGPTDALRTLLDDDRRRSRNIDTPGLIESALGNPNLKPETSGEFEGGFETRVSDNRANIDFTYYNKKTKDALISLPIAPSASPSATSVRTNLGVVQNIGLRGADQRAVHRSPAVRLGHDASRRRTTATRSSRSASTRRGIRTRRSARAATRDSVGFPVNGAVPPPVSLHRRERRRHHPGRPKSPSTRASSTAAIRSRATSSPSRTASICSRASSASACCSTTRAASTCCNNTWQFFCQQSPQACQERSRSRRCRCGARRARSANLYGTTVNGTQVHVAAAAIARTASSGASARCRRRSRCRTRRGEPSPRARREPHARRPQSARLDEVHRHRSRVELLDRRRRRRDFITTGTADVLHVPSQPPLLIRRGRLHMMNHMNRASMGMDRGRRRGRRWSTGCDVKEELLAPQNPSVIDPASVNSPRRRRGAARRRARPPQESITAGGESMWLYGGLLTDEWKSSDTFSQRNETDQRSVQTNNANIAGRVHDRPAVARIHSDGDRPAQQVHARLDAQHRPDVHRAGFVELTIAENFCNGMPDDVHDQRRLPVRTAAHHGLGLQARRVLLRQRAGAQQRQPTRCRCRRSRRCWSMRARVLVDQGQFANAAALVPVSAVPTNFQYLLTFDQTTGDNQIWSAQHQRGPLHGRRQRRQLTGVMKNALPFASAERSARPAAVNTQEGRLRRRRRGCSARARSRSAPIPFRWSPASTRG